ncbi:MAG: GNAT family N-acetyltransferase [Balneolaceae bacterium]
MKITTRRTAPEDLEELQALFVDTIRATCSNDYNKDQINAWTASVENIDRWNRLISHQYSIVAEIDNKIVGLAALDDPEYLDFLYVHKDYQRRGIANVLFDELKLESLHQGHYKLISDVSITAKQFFESKGFEVVKENKKEIRGVEITNYRMKEA